MSVLIHFFSRRIRVYGLVLLGGLLIGLPSRTPAESSPAYPPELIREYPPEYTRQIEARNRLELDELRQAQKAAMAKILAAPPPKLPHNPVEPIHVMLLFVDHWEPSDYRTPPADWFSADWNTQASLLADYWRNNYYQMALKHHDADGRMPQHTWFTYQLATGALDRIAQCAALGLGEVEIHLHHGTDDDTLNDNRVEFINKMRAQLSVLQDRGACLTAETGPQTWFGFIHGNWALDNSLLSSGVRKYCGVNNELHLLLSLGCFGDFTFPSGLSTQPPWYNKIFASMDSDSPKSYGDLSLIRELAALGAPPSIEELMLFEGPGVDGLQANIDDMHPPTLEMMPYWMGGDVHIPGCENWIFIKLMTHSAQALFSGSGGVANLVGGVADQFYTDLEKNFNDGVEYKLHYVTARETYNIVRAAIDGRGGDPAQYRDYVIPRPVNTRFYCSAPYRLLTFDPLKLQADLKITTLPPRDLVLWSNDIHDRYRVYEADTPGAYHVSDIQLTTATTANRLVLLDPTPSRYYRIFKSPLSTHSDWQLYR